MGNLVRQPAWPVPTRTLDAMLRNNFAYFVPKAFATVSSQPDPPAAGGHRHWLGSTGNGKNPMIDGRQRPSCGGTSRMFTYDSLRGSG
jgi:hypothetical protein